MKTIDQFEQFYNTDLQPVLRKLETRRRNICRKFFWIMGGTLLAVVVVVLAVLMMNASPAPALIALVIAGIVIGVSWFLLTKDFKAEFKARVIGWIVRFCDPSLDYSPKRHITERQFRDSRVFLNQPDRYRGEDHVAGKIGATEIEFSEVHAEYKTTSTDSKGHTQTHWHTIFKGLFVIADFHKHFRTVTVVVPDVAERLFGRLGKVLQKMNIARPGTLVKLEDPEFEKDFVVYGEDQVEARYILSTSLLQRITEFKRKTGREVHLSFVRSNVHVAISTDKDMFEPRVFRTLLDFRLARGYLEDLQLALGVVDELNLNTRIWSKE